VTLAVVVGGMGSISISTDKQVQVTQFPLTPSGPGMRAKADLANHGGL